MKIVILRHGKPTLDLEKMKSRQGSPAEMGRLFRNYETVELDPDDHPLRTSLDLVADSAVSISSNLPRAVASIQRLGLEHINTTDPLFRESAMPYLNWRRPRLSFYTWAIIFRLAWLCGFSRNGESLRAAKQRTGQCADRLETLAKTHGQVCHVGHGIMNRLLIKEMRRRGWMVPEHNGEHYWSCSVLQYDG